jgi:hypothetical protein
MPLFIYLFTTYSAARRPIIKSAQTKRETQQINAQKTTTKQGNMYRLDSNNSVCVQSFQPW